MPELEMINSLTEMVEKTHASTCHSTNDARAVTASSSLVIEWSQSERSYNDDTAFSNYQ